MSTYQSVFTKISALVCLVVLAVGCTKETDDFTILPTHDYSQFSDFDKLAVSSGFTVTVRQGVSRQVSVATTAANTPKLHVEQTNSTLVVRIDNKTNNGASGTVMITMPTLTSIDFSEGIQAAITGFSPVGLLVTLSGGSDATLVGRVGQLTGNLSGGSDLNAYGFPATNVTVNLSGGSEAHVAASGTLAVTASGGSSLFYKGEPTLTQNLSGGSSIKKE